MSKGEWKGIERLAATMKQELFTSEFYEELRKRLQPLLEAADKTIEFYDAHGGPMADLRKELDTWR